MTPDEELKLAIAREITDCANYPAPLNAYILGRDLSSVIDAVFNRLKAEGYAKPVVPNSRYPDAYKPAQGSKAVSAAPMNLMPDAGVMLSVGNDKGAKVVWSSFDIDDIKSLIRDIASASRIKIAVEE